MADQKTIKFVKPWGLHPVGEQITINAPIADLLIGNGRAKEVKDTPQAKKPKLQVKQATI